MNFSDVSALSGVAVAPLAVQEGPRAVNAGAAQEFRELMGASPCDPTTASCSAPVQSPAQDPWSMDIEQILMTHLPAQNASPAEFAMGLLRAQVKVSQAALAIEMVSKTTQSLSQGVQSLTTRS
jgi:hypothetical protein